MRSLSSTSARLLLGVTTVALTALTGCPHRLPDEQRRTGATRAVRLLSEKFERETTELQEKRTDVEIDTQDHDRTPRVVATGESTALELKGARAKLYGDSAGKEGWSVDNLVLLEVTDAEGKKVLARGAVGFSDGVDIGANRVDNVGRQSFTFDPGEIDITALLPETGTFRVRATALDYFGVGRVSNLYLVLEYPSAASEDDLRGQ